MIIKLVHKKEGAKGALGYARNLATYMADADPRRLQPDSGGLDYGLTLSAYMTRESDVDRGRNEPRRERVLYRGALIDGEGAGWDDGLAEMERRLERCSTRVKKPVRHGVLSYRIGEDPTVQQCQGAIAMLAEELGCEAATILWAAHADTDNVHIHALFVTVDSETGGALPFGRGPDGSANYKEGMQRALARIEHAQQLQAETGGRYEVIDGHVVRRTAPAERDAPQKTRKRTPIRQEILAFEEQSGFMSFTRFAQDFAGPLIDEASSWPELHRALAEQGLGIRPAVNGGELHAGPEHVKLSNVDRRHSWTQLVKPGRLGPYIEPEGLEPASYEPRVLNAEKATAWLRRGERERAIATRIDQRVAALLAARDAALGDLDARLSEHRADIAGFDGDPRLARDLASAWPRLRTSAASAIRAAFDARIDAVRGLRHAAAGAPDLDLVDLDAIGAPEAGIVSSWHSDRGPPVVAVLAGFDGERAGDVVRYWAQDGRSRSGQPALVDAGAIIWVNDRSDRSVEAALVLGKVRFGSVAVFGDAAYLEQCARAAERLGMSIETITAAEARRRAGRKQAARQASRQQALDRHVHDEADIASLRRVWARAYQRAAPADDVVAAPGKLAALSDVPHHRALPSIGSEDKVPAGKPRPERQKPPWSRGTGID